MLEISRHSCVDAMLTKQLAKIQKSIWYSYFVIWHLVQSESQGFESICKGLSPESES